MEALNDKYLSRIKWEVPEVKSNLQMKLAKNNNDTRKKLRKSTWGWSHSRWKNSVLRLQPKIAFRGAVTFWTCQRKVRDEKVWGFWWKKTSKLTVKKIRGKPRLSAGTDKRKGCLPMCSARKDSSFFADTDATGRKDFRGCPIVVYSSVGGGRIMLDRDRQGQKHLCGLVPVTPYGAWFLPRLCWVASISAVLHPWLLADFQLPSTIWKTTECGSRCSNAKTKYREVTAGKQNRHNDEEPWDTCPSTIFKATFKESVNYNENEAAIFTWSTTKPEIP